MDVQTRHDISSTLKVLKIKVKLLLSANRKSYMLRRLAQQRITLSDLVWPFFSSSVPSVCLKGLNANFNALCTLSSLKINILCIACYLYGS